MDRLPSEGRSISGGRYTYAQCATNVHARNHELHPAHEKMVCTPERFSMEMTSTSDLVVNFARTSVTSSSTGVIKTQGIALLP
jgi:hypothetical protein